MIRESEVLALIPLSVLALIYWVRDRFLFNRATTGLNVTSVQAKVLVVLYPVWVYLTWCAGLQSRRHNSLAYLSITGAALSGNLSTIAILNDSFSQTRQQVLSMIMSLIIAYGWTLYNMLAFISE